MNQERLADVGAVSTGVLTLAAWLANVEVYVRIGAAFVAMVAGVCSSLYHLEAWRQKRGTR